MAQIIDVLTFVLALSQFNLLRSTAVSCTLYADFFPVLAFT